MKKEKKKLKTGLGTLDFLYSNFGHFLLSFINTKQCLSDTVRLTRKDQANQDDVLLR